MKGPWMRPVRSTLLHRAWGTVAVIAALSAMCAGCAQRATPPQAPSSEATRPGSIASEDATAPFAPMTPDAAETTITFAIIGDYGTGGAQAGAVASLTASWNPAFIVTTGDDYYSEAGGTGTGRYRKSTSRFYSNWVSRSYETTRNAFFPALGNHDYSDAGLGNYRDYFRIPGTHFPNTSRNERYYDFEWADVHFFFINSNTQERDGTGASSRQARWLKDQLAASTAAWKLVVDHHPPYSSDAKHGSSRFMRWPFAEWGADAVVSCALV